jgi:hypothetical protein
MKKSSCLAFEIKQDLFLAAFMTAAQNTLTIKNEK